MRKGKRERPGLNVHLLCNLENGLETDAFLADISRTMLLRRVADRTDSSDVVVREAILIRLNDDSI